MMNLKEAMMPDLEENNNAKSVGILIACVLVLILCSAYVAGMLVGHSENGGGPMCAVCITKIAALVAVMLAICAYLYRPIKRMISGNNDLSKRERLNRNIMLLCGMGGAVIAIILILLAPEKLTSFNEFGSVSIPAAAAVGLAAFWGVGMPITAYFWHQKAIDEQEAAAYRDGGYYAAYAFIIATPTWWFLAHGGLVPEINGIAIFTIFNAIWVTVWFWKKYR